MIPGIIAHLHRFAGICALVFITATHARYILDLDFEDLPPGSFTNPYELGRKRGSGSPNFIDASVKRAGKQSLKFIVNNGRNEYTHPNGYKSKIFAHYWYGYSIYIEKWSNGWAIVGQMHGTPDRSNAECKKRCGSEGESWRAPPLSWNMSADGKHYTFKIAWSSQKCNCSHGPGRGSGIDGKKLYILDIIHEKWYDLVHHVYWDPAIDGTGRVEVWLKEADKTEYRKIVDYVGVTGYNDDVGTYFNFGAHTGKGKILYYDNVRMWEGGGPGFGSEGFRKVDPDPSGSSTEGATGVLLNPRTERGAVSKTLCQQMAVTITGRTIPLMRVGCPVPRIVLFQGSGIRFMQSGLFFDVRADSRIKY